MHSGEAQPFRYVSLGGVGLKAPRGRTSENGYVAWMKAAVVLAIIVLAGCQTDPGKAETISWLQSQGMDEGSAIVLASNKPALRRYILDRTQAPQDDA
jgi:hypothetical protein